MWPWFCGLAIWAGHNCIALFLSHLMSLMCIQLTGSMTWVDGLRWSCSHVWECWVAVGWLIWRASARTTWPYGLSCFYSLVFFSWHLNATLQEGKCSCWKVSWDHFYHISIISTTFCWFRQVARTAQNQGVEKYRLPVEGRSCKVTLQRDMCI